MPNLSNLSISIRTCVLFSSTIIGFARVRVDQRILLKEIPIFKGEGNLLVMMPSSPVAMCPSEFDLDQLNEMIWRSRQRIESAILDKAIKWGTGD